MVNSGQSILELKNRKSSSEEEFFDRDFYTKFAIVSSFSNEIFFINNFHFIFKFLEWSKKIVYFNERNVTNFSFISFSFVVKKKFSSLVDTWMNRGVHNTKCPFNSLPLLWLEQCRLFLMNVRSRFRPFDRGCYVTKCLANRHITINYSQLSNSIGIQRRNFVTSG